MGEFAAAYVRGGWYVIRSGGHGWVEWAQCRDGASARTTANALNEGNA